MHTLLDYSLNFLSFSVFSFVLWKKLKEDYTYDLIFSFTLISAFVAVLGVVLAENFLQGYSFWLTLLLQIICIVWFVKTEYFKFYELIDAFALSWLTFFLLNNASDLLTQLVQDKGISIPALYILLQVFLSGFLLILYKTVFKKYRSFSWYPSGKIGFIGLAIMALYFLLRSMVAITISGMLPFLGIQGLLPWNTSRAIDVVLSFCLFLIFSFWIYVRSDRIGGSKIAEKLSALPSLLEQIFVWKK